MPRLLRIEYPGAWHHIINRGSGKRTIFHGQEYYQLFLDLLHKVVDRYQIQVHAYCLMSNHYHLIVHSPQGNLSEAMQYLNSMYVRRYNKWQNTDGPLFRGRFSSFIVDVDRYLLVLSRYIHLNPVDANLVDYPGQYKWSSYFLTMPKYLS